MDCFVPLPAFPVSRVAFPSCFFPAGGVPGVDSEPPGPLPPRTPGRACEGGEDGPGGCSLALTATDAGARAFAKLGFGPTGYEEIWVREAGGSGAAALVRTAPILPSGPAGADRGAVREKESDEEVVGEAKMVVRYMDGIPDARGLT